MKKFLAPIAFALCLHAAPSHAALVDLGIFRFSAGASNNDSISSNLITMIGALGARANVYNVLSFEYNLSYSNAPGLTKAGIAIANDDSFTVIAAPEAGSTGSTGWQRYLFSQPVTSAIQISIGSENGSDTTSLLIRNMMDTAPVIPAVPEPETYALLLAGMALMGAVARRKSRLGMTPA